MALVAIVIVLLILFNSGIEVIDLTDGRKTMQGFGLMITELFSR